MSENDTNDVVVLNIEISSLLQRAMFPIYGVECLFHVIGNPRCQAVVSSRYFSAAVSSIFFM